MSVPIVFQGFHGGIIDSADLCSPKTGAIVTNHVFDFCCDTEPVDMFSY